MGWPAGLRAGWRHDLPRDLPHDLLRDLLRDLFRGACLAPLALVFPASARLGLSPSLGRAARGLGAGAMMRLRLVWWPAYARAIQAGLALVLAASGAIAMLAAATGMHHAGARQAGTSAPHGAHLARAQLPLGPQAREARA